MNKEQFEGSWIQLKGKVKEKWGKLTDNDLTQINGKWDQMVGSLEKSYGYHKEQAEKELKSWDLQANRNQDKNQPRNPQRTPDRNPDKQSLRK